MKASYFCVIPDILSRRVIWLLARMTIILRWSLSRACGQISSGGIVRALHGIEYDVAQMKSELSDLLSGYLDEFCLIEPYPKLKEMGFGPGYTAVDALTLYLMVRQFKPKGYIEVGSGLSTFYCSLAAERNGKEGHPLEITCIEPHPFDKLRTIPGIQVLSQEVQDADPPSLNCSRKTTSCLLTPAMS
jgi:hypothetical protein